MNTIITIITQTQGQKENSKLHSTPYVSLRRHFFFCKFSAISPSQERILPKRTFITLRTTLLKAKKNIGIHFQFSVNFHPNFVDGINFSENTINTQALTEERTLLSYMPPNSLTITIIYRLSLTPKDSI